MPLQNHDWGRGERPGKNENSRGEPKWHANPPGGGTAAAPVSPAPNNDASPRQPAGSGGAPAAGLAHKVSGQPNSTRSFHPPPNASPSPNARQIPAQLAHDTARLAAPATSSGKDQQSTPRNVAVAMEQGVTNKVLVNLAPCSPCSTGGGEASASSSGAANAGPSAPRTHCVSSYFNDDEYAKLKVAASGNHRRMGAVLRNAFLSGPAVAVPEPNRQKWVELAHAMSNLNQLTMKVNCGKLPEDLRTALAQLVEQIHSLRADLIGQRHKGDAA